MTLEILTNTQEALPFKVGDWISNDGYEICVEDIVACPEPRYIRSRNDRICTKCTVKQCYVSSATQKRYCTRAIWRRM